jgi:hypothetical protein
MPDEAVSPPGDSSSEVKVQLIPTKQNSGGVHRLDGAVIEAGSTVAVRRSLMTTTPLDDTSVRPTVIEDGPTAVL